MADTEVFIAAAEQYLASLDDDEFTALVDRTREPAADAKPDKSEKPATGVSAGAARFASRRGGK